MMDTALRKQLQIRARVESIYNKRQEDFDDVEAYNNFLEEREDIIFSLTEGEGVAESEAKLSSYATLNAASIASVEARHAEEVRVLAAAELSARESGPELESVSGTAAVFAGGAHPEPQGLAYRAAAAPGSLVALQGSFPAPLREGEAAARVTQGDIVHLSGLEAQLSPEVWERMALSSGWTREFGRQRDRQEAYGTLLLFRVAVPMC